MRRQALLTFALTFSILINLLLGGLVGFIMWGLTEPVFSGNYESEDIGLIARVQRANYLSKALKNQVESDSNRSMPLIIANLSQVELATPQEAIFGDYIISISMDSKVYNGLTKEQTKAVIAHAIGHYMLRHDKRGDVAYEIAADAFAVQYVEKNVLRSVIEKLVYDEGERRTRLAAIGS